MLQPVGGRPKGTPLHDKVIRVHDEWNESAAPPPVVLLHDRHTSRAVEESVQPEATAAKAAAAATEIVNAAAATRGFVGAREGGAGQGIAFGPKARGGNRAVSSGRPV